MPGVPPDALAQVKRGLKGLLFRKKRDRSQASVEDGAGPSSNAAVGSGDTTAASSYEARAPQSTASPETTVPHISEPANVKESKNIDLDPSAPHDGLNTVKEAVPEEAGPEKLEPYLPAEGMSATSGPLSDDLGYGGSIGSPVEDRKLELPPTEGATSTSDKESAINSAGAELHPEALKDLGLGAGGGVNKALPEEPKEVEH